MRKYVDENAKLISYVAYALQKGEAGMLYSAAKLLEKEADKVYAFSKRIKQEYAG